MEVKGTEKELKKLFGEKNRKKKLNFKFLSKKITKEQKYLIVFVALVGVIFISNMILLNMYYDLNERYITQTECSFKTRFILEEQLSNNSIWQNYLFIYSPFIKILLVAIAIGWAFHGVGFRII